MYVLPYGQMSLWGATVITNLMSAIPWVGQDIVEFLWGGLYMDEPQYGDVLLKILFDAGTTSNLVFGYACVNTDVKKPKAWGQSAGVRNISCFEASQRLNTENLIYAYLVGLFEGDGYFSLSKKGKYFQCEIGIELSIRDVELIHKIKDILGIGTIAFRERNGVKMVYFRVRKKQHLINYMLPIFDKYPMFSNKIYDYLNLKQILLSNAILYEDIVKYNRPCENLNTCDSILKASYFPAWLVGFIESEGCFSAYKLNKTSLYDVASFDICQTNGENLIMAIQKHLNLTTKVYKDKTNCFKLKVTSVSSIKNVITFIDNAPIKLQGYKKLQYLLWINKLRTIPRYNEKINLKPKY